MIIRRLSSRPAMCFGLWFLAGVCQAAHTDVVEFGQSRMVGEVKHLERGKLAFKTAATDTIQIDWAEVTSLVTSQHLRIEHPDGRFSFGSLGAGREPGRIALVHEGETREMAFAEIVALQPIESGFWERLDIDTSVAYSFAKSTKVEQLDLFASFEYDTEQHSRSLGFSMQSSESEAGDRSTRRNAQYISLRLHHSPFLWGWVGDYEDNDALGLDFRLLGAAVVGRDFYPRTTRRLRGLVGVTMAQEGFANGNERTTSELLIGGFVDWYQLGSPELDLSSSLIVHPSVSDPGRWRSRFDITLRWEIYQDLYWSLSLYDDYDSETGQNDPSSGGNVNDFGVSTGLGWSW